MTQDKLRINELIAKGEDLRQRLLPIWTEYRKFMLESSRCYKCVFPYVRIELDDLDIPDIDHVLNVLREKLHTIDCMEEIERESYER